MRIFFLWLFSTMFLFAGTLEIGERDSYWVLPYYEYAPIENMSDTPKELNNTIWIKDKNKLRTNPENRGFWIKLKVKNQDRLEKSLFLMSKRNYVYSIEYYLLDKDNKILENIKFENQLIDKKNSYNGLHRIFPLKLKKSEELQIFFKVQSFNMGQVSFNMVTKDYMTKFYQDYSLFKGIFFGIMLIMILYNIVLYLFFRYSSYLYYVLYVAFYFLYSVSYAGYLHHYTKLSAICMDVLLSIGYIGFLIFIGFFVKELFFSEKEDRLVTRWIGYIQIYFLMILVFKVIVIYQQKFLYIEIFTTFQNIILPFYYGLILYFLYKTSRRRDNNLALWYFVSWSVIGVIGFLQVAAFHNILSMESGYDHLFEASMAVETLLFSILLSLRIREIKREKDEKEKLLVQQNKLASMGEMIVSIAHQWRQPLAEINGVVMNLDLDYQNKKLDNEKLQMHLSDIECRTQHLSATMNDFMDFFNDKKEINHFSIFELFEHAISLVQMSSRKKVDIVYDMQSDIEVSSYRSELLQVLLIIINNSMDAFESSETKNPRIELGVMKKDNYIYFSIEDNAGGIPLHIIDKIFEPYFTSKPKTQGTGLGLYIMKIIIEKSMLGEVSLENSEEGVICSFQITNFVSSRKVLI
ncbi:MAG: sensor histidine kinase [Sulfurovaceae bacterium]|nr:sensor histidine kinase [Sulfurovaceae bacterium]